MNLIKNALVSAAVIGIVACSDDASTQSNVEPVSSSSREIESSGNEGGFFDPGPENHLPDMDSHVLAYRTFFWPELCDLPKEPTLIPINEGIIHRLMPIAEMRLRQRGGADQCNYYLVAWEYDTPFYSHYRVSSVSKDSIVIGNVTPGYDTVATTPEVIQEMFLLEMCGETLDLNTPIVDGGGVFGIDSEDPRAYEKLWLREDLLEAREQCVATCLANPKKSELFQADPERACSEWCDMYAVEAMNFYCRYESNDGERGIGCSAINCRGGLD